jgi:hypothetical protein
LKTLLRTSLFLAGAAAMSGCAVGEQMGWHHDHAQATEVQVASCDAATATLKGQSDYDVSHRACVHAKARQGVD